MRILLQFPEGLKQKALELSRKYESEGHEVFLSASACYGACDIAIDEARWLKADKIIHFGHNRFVKTDLGVPVEYVEYGIDIDVNELAAVLPHIKQYRSIALATTVQHIHQLGEMRAFFEKNGKKVFTAKGERADKEGQVLGCDAGAVTKVAKDVDAVVFVGNGLFHPLAIEVGKPVFFYDTSAKKVQDVSAEAERLRKRRKGAIAKALTCRRFGILVSTKPGQFNLAQAEWAKKELRKRGLEAAILAANELEPLSVNNFMVFDAYVTTACPRMADDSEEWGRPLLTVTMLKELFAIMDANKG
ncbi:MAG: diphthamide biosynthesis enzyme Dph2 [Candidatus ainarchaeum sp.]|nr:diphthamide biosynthesis enzyme Dph2 [Candidatus ainarchaeum sp.]